MADQYNSSHTGAEIDQAVSDVQDNKSTWSSKQDKITPTGLLKGNGSGRVSAAVPGTDYIASGNIVRQRLVATETTPSVNYEINWVYG